MRGHFPAACCEDRDFKGFDLLFYVIMLEFPFELDHNIIVEEFEKHPGGEGAGYSGYLVVDGVWAAYVWYVWGNLCYT